MLLFLLLFFVWLLRDFESGGDGDVDLGAAAKKSLFFSSSSSSSPFSSSPFSPSSSPLSSFSNPTL